MIELKNLRTECGVFREKQDITIRASDSDRYIDCYVDCSGNIVFDSQNLKLTIELNRAQIGILHNILDEKITAWDSEIDSQQDINTP